MKRWFGDLRLWLRDLILGPRLPAVPAGPERQLEVELLETIRQLERLEDVMPVGDNRASVNRMIMDLYGELENLSDRR